MTYPISSIIVITHEKLIYLDNNNDEQEIDLIECGKNRVDYLNYRNNFINENDNSAPKITYMENNSVG